MPRIKAASIDEHKAHTRRALFDAAKDLIEEAGTAEVPLGDVALVAGVGRTTLYDYFADRDDMIASLVEEELPNVVAALLAGVDATRPVDERLAQLVALTVEFVASDPVFGVILHREAGRMGLDAQKRIGASHSELSTQMMALYLDGVEQGTFKPMPPQLAGRLLQDTIMAGAKTLIASPGILTNGVTDAVTSFLLDGLGQR